MDNICSHCDKPNPADSIYCNQCGIHLFDNNQANEEYISDKTRRVVTKMCEKFKQEIKDDASDIKYNTLESIEEKATKWAKRQIVGLSVAITIATALISYAGLSGYYSSAEYKKLTNSAKQDITLQTQKITALIEKTIEKADKFDEKITASKNKLAGYNITELTQKLESLEKKQIQILKINRNSIEQFEKIKKLENSRFKIQVHYNDEPHEKWHNNIEFIREKLDYHGFRLGSRNIATVTTDIQEIIIYSKISKEKADLIKKLILPKFKPINIRVNHSSYNDDFDMVIKLCPDKQDNNCIINTKKKETAAKNYH